MPPRSCRSAHLPTFGLSLVLALFAGGCRTPDGPHHPIPDQSLSIATPEGLTRVIFLNTNYPSEASGAGPVRIRFNGQQIPSVWPERYVQAFVEPGVYDLVIEQSKLFFWERKVRVTVQSDQFLISVYRTPFGLYPAYEVLDELPSDFETAFQPGRHPKSW